MSEMPLYLRAAAAHGADVEHAVPELHERPALHRTVNLFWGGAEGVKFGFAGAEGVKN